MDLQLPDRHTTNAIFCYKFKTMKTSELPDNLTWLKTGLNYICREPLPGLEKSRTYRFESFSSDPLGDTRQYLFTDLKDQKAYGVELTGNQGTPRWSHYLSEAK